MKYLDFFENRLQSYSSDIEYTNLLLVGDIGSGKSSFVNTCATALGVKDTHLHPAKVLPASVASVTRKVCKKKNTVLNILVHQLNRST